MIQMQIKNRHVRQLAFEGKPKELIKELALGVTYTLERIELHEESGNKIPLSQAIVEFGQLLILMGEHNGEELDKGRNDR